jgi:hypothetical protein
MNSRPIGSRQLTVSTYARSQNSRTDYGPRSAGVACARAPSQESPLWLSIYAMLSMTLPYCFRSGFPAYAVELNGIEPMTSGLQSPRSPS